MAARVYCFDCDYEWEASDAEVGVWWRGECPRCEAPLGDEDFVESED